MTDPGQQASYCTLLVRLRCVVLYNLTVHDNCSTASAVLALLIRLNDSPI